MLALLGLAEAVGGTLGSAPPYRFMYSSDSDPATVASDGWNLIDTGSQWTADRTPAGTQGLVWVGDYDNSTCSWQVSDTSLSATVSAAKGDPKVFGYFISDEPNPYACPNAPAQHKARTQLIHSLDAKPVVVVLDSNGFSGRATQDALDQLPLWKGTADVFGLDPYPCYQGGACDYSWIDRTISAADAAGLNYWGVVQAFNDSSWRWPTASELSHMLSQWAGSKQSGYMVFAWTWAGNSLTSQPALLDVFKQFNAGAPKPVPATRRGVLQAVTFSVSTHTPHAGQELASRLRFRVAKGPTPSKGVRMWCKARVGATAVHRLSRTLSAGDGVCRWLIPAGTAGQMVRGWLTVGFEDSRLSRTFGLKIR